MGDAAVPDTAVARDALTATLARLKPAKVRAVLHDGESRDIAVPNRRKRWAHVVEVLASLAWARIECLDSKGGLLGAIEADEQPEVDDVGKATDRERGLLALLVKAQDMALARHERGLGLLLDGYRVMLDSSLVRLSALERGYGDVLKLAHEATLALAAQSGGADENADTKLLMDFLSKKLGLDVKKKKPDAPNGAAKPAGDA